MHQRIVRRSRGQTFGASFRAITAALLSAWLAAAPPGRGEEDRGVESAAEEPAADLPIETLLEDAVAGESPPPGDAAPASEPSAPPATEPQVTETAAPPAAEPEPPAERRVRSRVIEEIVVTARRREEALQDIPIAVSVLGAQEIRDRGITNVEDLAKSVPSLQITSGQSNQIYIRGIGQRTGFVRTDSGVGVYLDDLFIPRAEGQLLDTVDVHSIQVLRGPQGTLFGKNTTGGALVLTLAKPHDELEGYVEGTAGNFGLLGARAMLNAPVRNDLFVRIAGNRISDDGYTEDIGQGNRSNNTINREAALLQTRWEPAANVTLDALGFYGRIHERFPANTCRIANENALFLNGLFMMWPGDTDPSNPTAYRANCESNSRDRLPDLKTNLGDTNFNFDDDLDTGMIGLTLDWRPGSFGLGGRQIGEDLRVKTIFGFQISNRGPIMSSDNDGGPANFVESHKPRDSDRQSLSLELQLNGSALGGRLSYTSGLFGMRETNDEPFVLVTNIVGLDGETLAFLGAMQAPPRPPPGGTVPFVGALTGPIVDSQFDLTNLTLGPFFQASYDLTDRLQLTLGARYTAERRDTDLVLFESDRAAIANRLLLTGLFGPPISAQGAQFQQYLGPGRWADDPVGLASDLFPDENRNGIPDFPLSTTAQRDSKGRTFSRFTPMASIAYGLPESWLAPVLLDSVLAYFTWSNGFKSGFFEPRLTDGLVLIKQETVENREIGFKIDGLDRSVRVNAAAYSMLYDNLQLINVSTDSQGNLAVVFDNVAKARIDGGELEVMWVPHPQWLTNLAYSHNRYNYLEFTDRDLFAQAIQQQTVIIDRSDEPFPVAPEQALNFGVQYMRDTSVGTFVPRLDLTWKSEIFLGLDHGSALAFERDRDLAGFGPATVVDLRLGWTNQGGDLGIAAFAKNVTDHRYLSGAASVADSVGTFAETYADPRRYGIELRKSF